MRAPVTSAATSPVLVGRDAELAALVSVVAEPPAIITIEGEAGVGKSRLVAELLGRDELQGRRILRGQCHPIREPFPLGPVVEALCSVPGLMAGITLPPLAGALRSLLPEVASALPRRPPDAGDPRVDRHILYRAVLEVLASLGSLVCVLEDLHWCDENTAEFLVFLVRQLPKEVILMVTFRPEDLPSSAPLRGLAKRPAPPTRAATIELTPLDVPEVSELAMALLEPEEMLDIPPDFARRLHERTGGIPFAIEEVMAILRGAGPLATSAMMAWVRARIDDIPVPAAIRHSVLERAARLGGDAQLVTEAAAVLGVPASDEVLAEIAGVGTDRSAQALQDALSAVVLLEITAARYGFRHSLAAQAVYEAIARPRRRQLHLRAAGALERLEPPPVAQLARHYREAEMPHEWVRCAEAAADLASARHDHDGAEIFLREALLVPGIEPRARASMAEKLAVAVLSSRIPRRDAADLLRRLLADGDLAPGVRGRIRSWLGLMLIEAGQATEGRREQVEALDQLGGDPEHAIRVMINLASPWALEGDEAEHLAWLDRAAALAEQRPDAGMGLAVRIARALYPRHCGIAGSWEAVRALPWDDDSPATARALLWGTANLISASFYLGHYQQARAFLDDARSRASELGWAQHVHIPETAELLLDWTAGTWEGLEQRAGAQVETMSGLPGWAAPARLVAGHLALARGHFGEAQRWLREAFTAAREAGNVPLVAAVIGGLARIQLQRHAASEALDEARMGIDLLERKGVWVWAGELAPAAVEAAILAGYPELAAELTAKLGRGLRGRDAPLARAALAECKAMRAEAAGDLSAAANAFGDAMRRYQQLPRVHEAARAEMNAGRCRLESGDRSGGEQLSTATRRLAELGASEAGRARQLLRHHRVAYASPWRGGRRGYGGGLTPREAQALELAAGGLTDAEIGKRLFLSTRTAGHYVTSAMHKLGIESRRALIRRAFEGASTQ